MPPKTKMFSAVMQFLVDDEECLFTKNGTTPGCSWSFPRIISGIWPNLPSAVEISNLKSFPAIKKGTTLFYLE